MKQDPFKNFKPINSYQQTKKKSKNVGTGFIEQLKSIGSSVTDSLSTDVVKGAATSIFEQVIGSTKSGRTPQQEGLDTTVIEEMVREQEQRAAKEADQNARQEERAIFAHNKGKEKVLFSFADEKLKQELGEVRQELVMLVKSMGMVQKQVEQAVIQEVVNPGLYHKNFFTNLRTWLITMQKSLDDASLWLSMSTGRKQKGAFWTNTKKHGTKYSMSQERQSAMSIG